MSQLMPSHLMFKKTHVIALLLIGFAFGFYVYSIHTTYMIADEYLVYRFTRDSLGDSIAFLANGDVHPPLWFSFFWGWWRIVGVSDFAGRMQAILFSLLTLSLVYQLGKRLFGAARYGLFAMAILICSSLFFSYSLEIRPYAFAMLMVTLSMLAFYRWIRLRTPRTAAVYGASVAALLYIHYFLMLFVLIQILYFAVFTRPTRRLWGQAMGAAGLVFLLWLPWFPSFLTQIQHIRAVEVASGGARGLAGSGATTELTSAGAVLKLIQLATNGQPWLYAIILAIGLYYGWRKASYRLAFAWGIGVPLVTFVVNLVLAVYSPRYIVNFIIGLALVMAAGLGWLPNRVRWISLTGFLVISFWALPSQLPHDIIPYSDLLKQLVVDYRPGDSIYIDPPENRGVVFNWQYSHSFTTDMRRAIVQQVNDALPARRIWYLTESWFDDTIQANFHLIEESHPRVDGFGNCDANWCYLVQLMEAPPWNAPQTFGENMAFWGADVEPITDDTIHTRLWWKIEQTPSTDYSMSLRLLDTNGELISQADGPINHYGVQVVNTSQLEIGKIYIDFRDLTVPPSLPAGDYQLNLVVYDWQTDERLFLPNGADSLALISLHLGE